MRIDIPGGQGPSFRSLIMAYAMAEHQLERPIVFADSISSKLVNLRRDVLSGLWPGKSEYRADTRLQMALCHRFADDAVVAAMNSGVNSGTGFGMSQLVILQAGLDMTCYRRPYPGVCLFELDDPQTQAWKRQRLACVGIDSPPALRYMDFDHEMGVCADRLLRAGYDPELPTVVVWLDATVFGDKELVASTLEVFGRHRGPIELIFDYVQPATALPERTRATVAPLLKLLEQSGLPMTSLFTRAEVASGLRDNGFHRIEDLAWNDLVRRYLPGNADLPDPVGGRLVRARLGVAAR